MKNYLWQEGGGDVDAAIAAFTAGEDVLLDRQLFVFDIQATAAHVRGLQRIGIVSDTECDTLCRLLDELRSASSSSPTPPLISAT